MEQGILKIKNKGRRELKVNGKPFSIPKEFDTSHLEKGNYDCELVIENNKIIKIFIEKKELPKDTQVLEQKTAKAKAKEEKEQAEKEAIALEKKHGDKFKNDLFQKYQDNNESAYQVFAPKDTLGIPIPSYQAENFALKLNKFATSDQAQKEGKFVFFKKNIRAINDELIPFFGNFPFDTFLQKQKKQAKLITSHHIDWIQTTDGRLVVGLGGASVYETSMTLHHIYGIPYIPASSIKGVLRSWILINCFDGMNDPNAEERAMKDNVFAATFGTDDNASDLKAHRGNLIFFDAFPIKAPTIEADIMTPHYSDYYSDSDNKKQTAPSDTQKLTPIPFLTVAEGTEFQFIVGEKGNEGLLNKPFHDQKTIIEWLKEALSEHGIGAKTAVGYGYFNEIE